MDSQLVGAWRLVSWERRRDGEVVLPFGPGVTGRLIYTADGFMSAHLMGAGRSRMGAPPEAIQEAVRRPWRLDRLALGLRAMLVYIRGTMSYLAYSGTYEVQGDEVVHRVDSSLLPDWVDTDQRRAMRLEEGGDRLVLSTPSEIEEAQNVLVWARER